jgi:curved DNA-binding protein CbpA
MIIKDYYKILDVKPSASSGEIKRSYRKLAMKYHPDKNHNDVISASVFNEITEAYKVLSDPGKRKEYNYTRHHIYGTTYDKVPELTRTSLVADIDMLAKIVTAADPFRVNRDAIYFSILQLLSEQNINFVTEQHDAAFTSQVVEKLLLCARLLGFNHAQRIAVILASLAGKDALLQHNIQLFINKARWHHNWQNYKTAIVVIIALALCLLIFLLGK